MATVDTSYVNRELRAIAGRSRAVRTKLRQALEALEDNPSQFEPLKEVPPQIAEQYPNATFRKVKLEHNPHMYRLVVVHWTFDDKSPDHVDVIYAFPRKSGYPIDWDEVDEFMSG